MKEVLIEYLDGKRELHDAVDAKFICDSNKSVIVLCPECLCKVHGRDIKTGYSYSHYDSEKEGEDPDCNNRIDPNLQGEKKINPDAEYLKQYFYNEILILKMYSLAKNRCYLKLDDKIYTPFSFNSFIRAYKICIKSRIWEQNYINRKNIIYYFLSKGYFENKEIEMNYFLGSKRTPYSLGINYKLKSNNKIGQLTPKLDINQFSIENEDINWLNGKWLWLKMKLLSNTIGNRRTESK